jgi:glyoxylase-like metal-dependent hydrolase (beta-lactamase superfamily II)
LYDFSAKINIMWQYRILSSGFFHADGGAMFGAIPKRAWQRRCPAEADNTCVLAMNGLLLRQGQRVVLLDTGVGAKPLQQRAGYRFHGLQHLNGLLREQGLEPEDVTDVVLSHLHFDHCGGCTYPDDAGRPRVAFPRATHWVHQQQWDSFLQPNGLEADSFRSEDLLPVAEAGLLQLVTETEITLAPGLRLSAYDGHTAGQLVAFFDTEDGIGVFPGDVIPTRAHLSDLWISAYDIRPLASLSAKMALKAQMQACGAPVRVFFYHDPRHLFLVYT